MKSMFPAKYIVLTVVICVFALFSSCALQSPFVDQYRAGQYDDAITSAKATIVENPEYGYAWYYLGISYVKKEQWSAAEYALLKAKRLTQGAIWQDVASSLAFIYKKTGQMDKAMQIYNELVSQPNPSPYDWIGKGFMYIFQGQGYQQAQDDFDRALDLVGADNGAQVLAYRGKAFAYVGMGNMPLALQMLDGAASVDTAYAAGGDYKMDKALVYYAAGEMEQLRNHMTTTRLQVSMNTLAGNYYIAPVVQRRQAHEARIASAAQFESSGNLVGALDAYLQILRNGPFDHKVVDKAISVAARLASPPSVSEEARRHAVFGQSAAKNAQTTNDFERVAGEYEQAIRLAPWWADLYINAALVLEQLERTDEAAAYLRHYLLARPYASDAQAVRTKIYELEYAKIQRAKQMKDWQGAWRFAGSAALSSKGTYYGTTPKQESKGWTMEVLEVNAVGDATVRMSAEGTGKCIAPYIWKGKASPRSLTAMLKKEKLSGTGFTLGPGELEVIIGGEGITVNFKYLCSSFSVSGLFDENVTWAEHTYTYNGPLVRGR